MSAIEVDHVTKEYRLGALQGLKQTILNAGARLAGRKPPEGPLFKALDDVHFSIEPGEVVGIIGHNGAGKSTLLKMLAHISTPTRGSVRVNGRIAPLIEVGAGFVPDFTGRENVYLNGSILGMPKKEIDKKFDEIVDFAEMAEFIDTPVKRFSSGMQVRLAFAVATSIESEILIVDEVLAVGDLAFQRKCFDRMEDLIRRQGRTVLLVSHNIRQVQRLCSRALLMHRGRLQLDGPPKQVCDAFYAQNDSRIHETAAKQQLVGHQASGELDFLGMHFEESDGTPTEALAHDCDCVIAFSVRAREALHDVTFGFGFHTTDFLYLATHNSEVQLPAVDLEQGEYIIRCSVKRLPLLPGVFSMRFGVTCGSSARAIFYAENLRSFQVTGDIPITQRDGFFALESTWASPQRVVAKAGSAALS